MRILRAPCMGRCENAPVAEVGHAHVENTTLEIIAGMMKEGKSSEHPTKSPASSAKPA